MDESDQNSLYLEKHSEKINSSKHTPNLKKYHNKINPSLVPKDVNLPRPVYNEELEKVDAIKEIKVPEHPNVLEEDSDENTNERRKAIKNSRDISTRLVLEEEESTVNVCYIFIIIP